MQAERTRQSMIEPSHVRVPGRAPRWIVPAVKASLVIADAAIAVLAFMLAFYVREGASVRSAAFEPYAALLVFVVAIRLLSFRSGDLYRVRGEFSFDDDAI